jgi:small subunit ribosomal protein S7
MSRKARKFKRHLSPDQKYNSLVVSKFINHIMLNGNKALASKIFYSAIDKLEPISKEKKTSTIDLFYNALETLKPKVKMKSRRVGGATYQVPKPLRETEGEMIAMKWLIEAARAVNGKPMYLSLFNVLADTIDGRGNALKKKEEMHRTAEANKAFAHFA